MSQAPDRPPVSRAADAVQNQADTILSELHGSIGRAKAFRAFLDARATEKVRAMFRELEAKRRARDEDWAEFDRRYNPDLRYNGEEV